MQTKLDNNTRPFVLHSMPASREAEGVLAQDGGRSGDLEPYTLLGRIASSGKWVPYTTVSATDGSSVPAGIYLGKTITEADIQAGDVEDLPILTNDAHFDEDQLVLENDITLGDVVSAITVNDGSDVDTHLDRTVRDLLAEKGLIAKKADSISNAENS